MKVILRQQVPKVGEKYDVKEVSDGYARNFLLKKGLAQVATPKEIARIEQKRKEESAEKNIQHDLLVKNIEALNGKEVRLEAKANKKGHLFASVQPEDIAKAIKGDVHISIPTECIQTEPIKEVGEHAISVQTEGAYATITLHVVAQ